MTTQDRSAELDHLVLLYIQDGIVRLTTRNMSVLTACQQASTYKHSQMVRERGKNKFQSEAVPCYLMSRNKTVDAFNFVFGIGLLERLMKLIRGFPVVVETYEIFSDGTVAAIDQVSEMDTRLPAAISKRDWAGFRDWQQDATRYVLHRRFGRFNVPTGDGKTRLIAKLCHFLRDSRIVVVAKTLPPVSTLYSAAIGEGIIGAIHTSKKKSGRVDEARVFFTTTGLLPKYESERFDVLFGDEIHEHATSEAVSAIMGAKVQRRFGFSGNADKRQDNAQMWMEALYGPLIIDRRYQDSLADGNVVPIYYRTIGTIYRGKPVKTSFIPERSKRLVWRNNDRNSTFAAVGHYYLQQGKSVLALVENTEQALAFRKYFKAPVVVGMPEAERISYFIAQGLLRHGEIEHVVADGNDLLRKFAAGEIKAVIAGPMWHKAVDIPVLEVVLRLDPRASLVSNTQIPGRLARKSPGKEYGLIVDARDEFDSGLHSRFLRRLSYYTQSGWTEKEV